MEYKLKIGPETRSVKAEPLDQAGCCTITVGDQAKTLEVKAVSPNHFHLTVNGRASSVFVAPTGDGTWVWNDGRARLVFDADKTDRKKSRGPGADAPTEVTPPTPASVVRIVVETGSLVKKGDPCVVVSAMKMEITLPAPYSGTVSAINTEVGAQVSPGDILVDIERAEEEQTDD
jgi:biotin carboxyl carrier protein